MRSPHHVSAVAPTVRAMSGFTGFEDVWAARLGGLRNVVRQHVIAAQLGEHLGSVRTALDVGCGQGTQAIALARRGLAVTGVDPAADLLDRLRADAREQHVQVRALRGDLAGLTEVIGGERFDLVCAHGLLMYLDDAYAGLEALAARVAPGGLVSFTVRNGDALTPHEALSVIFAQLKSRFDSLVLGAFIRMMGVYPPGSIVQLVNERYAIVASVNSSRPLRPRIIVHDPQVPKEEALILDLETVPELGIRRSLKPSQLPRDALDYLSPRQRICYFFERAVHLGAEEAGV